MNINRLLRKRFRIIRLLVLLSVFFIGYLGAVFKVNIPFKKEETLNILMKDPGGQYLSRKLQEANDTTSDSGSLYPPEIFTDEQLKHGAVCCHVVGMIYMFVALAIVCDEFFVPSLGCITTRLKISEDVAGATFMAAGGSAPELFTSLIGVFLSKSNVGIGTIVGSAVFNILFVIGMCALCSKDVLTLTWWPLFRDVTFYSVDLLLLIAFFLDGTIYWHEALILLFGYFAYVTFMKFNETIERFVKSKLRKGSNKVGSASHLLTEKPQRSMSLSILHSGGNRYRHGILDLMIHTIDPLQNAKVHENAMNLHAIATLKVVIGTTTPTQNEEDSPVANGVDKDNNKVQSNGHVAVENGKPADDTSAPENSNNVSDSLPEVTIAPVEDGQNAENGLVEDEEPLDLSWPDNWKKRINYVIVAPIIYVLWITLPDVRREEKKKWFMVTFFGSIFWIGGFSYLMVWWANTTGETIGLTPAVMGLTILAAGTSIPDLITSVIVAKKGFGDMAVSSSVGSNIFDITVGLPIPWLLYEAVYVGKPIDVDSNGLACSICLLFLMLMAVIISIAVSKWRMSRTLGISMLVLYVIFLVLSVLLEINVVPCPIEV
ncbi:sodium/potassium/calcium exchanger 2-like isoform X2 [Mizuhopecten yessoensis]|uniref:Sodium/potassium/calcium exchanger 2 n=1 Tax=Mizuhopecten yessoensis TaxID=6573 RepID=A0A210QG67_MIZYE|nr:sodium/potassium/calcium exchanger 2-like isoform X2 [Mizuhopecten yessoensis]OWF47736.1 Sodium/potassium/calcium exchanger 2 [Mizuhopecten yessoensis]